MCHVPRGRAAEVLLDSLLSALNCQDLVALEMVSASGLTDLKAPFDGTAVERRWHHRGGCPKVISLRHSCQFVAGNCKIPSRMGIGWKFVDGTLRGIYIYTHIQQWHQHCDLGSRIHCMKFS